MTNRLVKAILTWPVAYVGGDSVEAAYSRQIKSVPLVSPPAMTTTINFKFGSLIRTGPRLASGGKWDATLDESVRNERTNADLTIMIRLFLQKIDPVGAATGMHPDGDNTAASPSLRFIQRWAPGEFEHFTTLLVSGAQRFWDGVFWLEAPRHYTELNWPDVNPTHRCHLYCKFELEQVMSEAEAHYTVAIVRAQDGETFRSSSRLYSQMDIKSERLIPHSTRKFWTHYHEVGHLLGLGHIGHEHRNVHGDNRPAAYGVTRQEMVDVMGRGSLRRYWHALPWREAAEAFTGVPAATWITHMHHLRPGRIGHTTVSMKAIPRPGR